MIYAVKCVDIPDARTRFNDYISENKANIKKAFISGSNPIVVLNNLDEVHFITHQQWKRTWCYGRTYQFFGEPELWHGDHPFKQEDESVLRLWPSEVLHEDS